MKQNTDQPLQYYQDQTISNLLQAEQIESPLNIDTLILNAAKSALPKKRKDKSWKYLLSAAATVLLSFTFLLNMNFFANKDFDAAIKENIQMADELSANKTDSDLINMTSKVVIKNETAQKATTTAPVMPQAIRSARSHESTISEDREKTDAQALPALARHNIGMFAKQKAKKRQLPFPIIFDFHKETANQFKTNHFLITPKMNLQQVCVNQYKIATFKQMTQQNQHWHEIILNTKQKISLRLQITDNNDAFFQLKSAQKITLVIKPHCDNNE